jgi:hypothetical protein
MNIKNIIQKKIALWGTNKTLTYLVDSHSCTIGRVHLIGAVVLVSHGEFLQFTRDVIGSTGFGVPICIHAIGVDGRS